MAKDQESRRAGRRSPWGWVFPAVVCAAVAGSSLVFLQDSRSPASISEGRSSLGLRPESSAPMRLFMLDSLPTKNLVRILDTAWALPRVQDAVPNLAPERLPEDVDRLDIDDRKRLFLRSVVPHVLAENRRIRALRMRLVEIRERLRSGSLPTEDELSLVGRLAGEYRVEVSERNLARLGADAALEELLDRVDVVPPSLALAQAAIESAWGGSRFARLGNALFGQWVFAADKGIAPLFRAEGEKFSVARFDNLSQAVAAYVRNLNTLWAYEDFRGRRRQMREAGAALESHDLAEGLRLYSERRDAYVSEVKQVIRNNRLTRFDARRLAPVKEDVWRQVLADAGVHRRMRPIFLPE